MSGVTRDELLGLSTLAGVAVTPVTLASPTRVRAARGCRHDLCHWRLIAFSSLWLSTAPVRASIAIDKSAMDPLSSQPSPITSQTGPVEELESLRSTFPCSGEAEEQNSSNPLVFAISRIPE